MYKKIFTIAILAFATSSYAQVIIGNATGTASNKTSVLLEFANTNDRGIIVPYVRSLPTGTALVGGAIILDARTPTAARMRFYAGTDGWKDLNNSANDADVSTALAKQPTGITEATNANAVIGYLPATADGALVLESTTKALVLPQVDDTDRIINPAAGMLVYINKTGAKRLAVFNGKKWTYFKP